MPKVDLITAIAKYALSWSASAKANLSGGLIVPKGKYVKKCSS